MTDEVRAMIKVRHEAEQRGLYSPLGRLLWLETQHGVINFPERNGEGGPDIAVWQETVSTEIGIVCDPRTLIVLGHWSGLPAIRIPSNKPCPVCLHDCDCCDGKGVIQCNGLGCGGRGYVLGSWVSCPGPGCHAETGKYNSECERCAESPIRGQIAEKLPCARCKGTKLIKCERCRGTLKFSTGKINGSLDYRLPSCKACEGTGFKGEWQQQDVKKFTNATIREYIYGKSATSGRRIAAPKRTFLVLGPIQAFALQDFETARPRIFDVTPDEKGDLLALLVPVDFGRGANPAPQKAYLVGGVVRPREAKVAVSA